MKHLAIPSTVYEELKGTPFFDSLVSLDALQQIVHDLKTQDYYEFSEGAKKMLLE